jgi:SNF2 family DNA or RNA helicase
MVTGFVTPAIKSLVDAGNIQGAIEALGGSQTCNLLELVKARKEEELELATVKYKLYSTRQDKEKSEKWELRKLETVRQLKELDKRFSEVANNVCNICLEKLDKPVLEPGCQNVFCGKCLLTWLQKNNKCPLCRQVVDKSELIYINNEKEGVVKHQKRIEVKTKQDTIIDIVSKKPEGKFLIFSAYTHTFKMIKNSLLDSKISVGQVFGSAKTRQTTLSDFKSGGLNVLFLNSSRDAAGLDLRETTDIIIYHDISPSNESQIIGRANRIGRSESLTVHYLQVHI